jgi:parvulin-like peptidyl-prolyl isomerase
MTPSLCGRARLAVVLVAVAIAAVPGSAQTAGPDPRPASAPALPAVLPSIFLHPMYFSATPPPLRSLRAVEITWKGQVNATAEIQRTREEAYRLAEQVVVQLRAGVAFDTLSSAYSTLPNSRLGGVLGTFAEGMLGKQLDAFLYGAEIGDVSAPFETPRGWLVSQRIETHAAARTLMIEGTSESAKTRCAELCTQVRAGADFAELAREHSADKLTAARGGALAIFEVGAQDRLLKAAAFRLAVGETSDPIESPLGWHLVQRVAPDSIDPALAEPVWVRARAILVAQSVVPLGAPSAERSAEHAFDLVQRLRERVLAGEDMERLARESCDDHGGRTRGGDLGWIHRYHPNRLPLLDALWAASPGELLEPFQSNVGWILLRREY